MEKNDLDRLNAVIDLKNDTIVLKYSEYQKSRKDMRELNEFTDGLLGCIARSMNMSVDQLKKGVSYYEK